jgi:hypothetical protein
MSQRYSASRLDEVEIYLCPSVSICGSYFLMYCTQLANRYSVRVASVLGEGKVL